MSVPVERYYAQVSISMTRVWEGGEEGAHHGLGVPGGRAARAADGVERDGAVGDGVLRRAAELLARVEAGREMGFSLILWEDAEGGGRTLLVWS